MGLLALGHKLTPLGLKYSPRRSTISDAGVRRSAEVFEHIYNSLLARYGAVLSDSRSTKIYHIVSCLLNPINIAEIQLKINFKTIYIKILYFFTVLIVSNEFSISLANNGLISSVFLYSSKFTITS